MRRVLHRLTQPSGILSGRTIAVFGSSTIDPSSESWRLAEEIGRRLAASGARVVTGGFGGVMEAACRGARAGGGTAVGVTFGAAFPERTPNPWLSETLEAGSLLQRLARLFDAEGFVVLEGSVGTLAEFFVGWHHALLEREKRRPLVCLGSHWAGLLRALRESGFVTEEELHRLVITTETVDGAIAALEEGLKARPLASGDSAS